MDKDLGTHDFLHFHEYPQVVIHYNYISCSIRCQLDHSFMKKEKQKNDSRHDSKVYRARDVPI